MPKNNNPQEMPEPTVLLDGTGKKIVQYVQSRPEGSTINEIVDFLGARSRHPIEYRLMSMHVDGLLRVVRRDGRVFIYPISSATIQREC